MTKRNVKLDRLTAEFMLDLPEGTSITDLRLEGDVVHLELETDVAFPEGSSLKYEHDDFGNTALVGSE
jgi:hypothetical protein